MKRKLTRLLITLLVTLNVMGAASALAAEVQEATEVTAAAVEIDGGIVTPQAEETCWYYREYNGWIQRRLWSYTYAKWLTEWQNMAPA